MKFKLAFSFVAAAAVLWAVLKVLGLLTSAALTLAFWLAVFGITYALLKRVKKIRR